MFKILLKHVQSAPPLVPVRSNLLASVTEFERTVLAGEAFVEEFLHYDWVTAEVDWWDLGRRDGPLCGLEMLYFFTGLQRALVELDHFKLSLKQAIAILEDSGRQAPAPRHEVRGQHVLD